MKHRTSKQEIADLLAIADRDVSDAQIPGLSSDRSLSIAHNALLLSADAALAASGYRAERSSQHYRIIQSLEHTVALDPQIVARIDAFRKKRNTSSYDRAGSVSEGEAREMLALAQTVRLVVGNWLKAYHPELTWKVEG